MKDIDASYVEKINQERLSRIEGEIVMLKDISNRQNETIFGLSLGMERMNNTIRRIIDSQEEHANRLKEIEALSFVSRHWKFMLFTILAIVIISLSIHSTLKEIIGWVF